MTARAKGEANGEGAEHLGETEGHRDTGNGQTPGNGQRAEAANAATT